MRTSSVLPVILATLLVALVGAGTAGAAAGATYASCSGGYNPDGTPGSFYRQIKAKRVTCPAAKKVVKAWVVAQFKTDGAVSPAKARKVLGFTCRGRTVGGGAGSDDPDGGLAVTCKQGTRHVVKFYGHP